ncbi:Uncharacterized protein Fot_16284 [Forsythia ovata]|uniref:Uncharacterized protein n=1 Tax=Forsythia ovata TaxID=205694 RepID=A0ABD1WBK8_9LAMI
MEKKRNQKLHDKHQKHHKPPHDAYELYESEHTVWWLNDAPPRPSARVNSDRFTEISPSEHTVQWLNDVPPRPSSRVNYDRFKEISPKAEKRIMGDYRRSNEDSTDGKRVIYDDDVDAEAADFIKFEHEKLGLNKWMSIKDY